MSYVALTVAVVALVVSVLALWRAKPVAPPSPKRDPKADALVVVRAAEQLRRLEPKSGQDKARDATGALLDLCPELQPATARMLVEWAVAERKK